MLESDFSCVVLLDGFCLKLPNRVAITFLLIVISDYKAFVQAFIQV